MGLFDLLPASWAEGAGLVVAYLLGSLPFGLLLGFARGVDIRASGSGNIGATNAGRVLGRPFAYAAFAGDFGKGWVASLWIGPAFAESPERSALLAVLCGGAAVAGHVWPLYLRFRGGKAVATGCGAVFGLDPVVFLGGGLVWCLAALLFRFVGLASILMVASFPLLAAWRTGERYGLEVVWGTALLALLVIARHRANIARMLAGTEPKMGRGRSA